MAFQESDAKLDGSSKVASNPAKQRNSQCQEQATSAMAHLSWVQLGPSDGHLTGWESKRKTQLHGLDSGTEGPKLVSSVRVGDGTSSFAFPTAGWGVAVTSSELGAVGSQ